MKVKKFKFKSYADCSNFLSRNIKFLNRYDWFRVTGTELIVHIY